MQNAHPTSVKVAEPPPETDDLPCRGLAAIFNSATLDVGRILAASTIFYFHAGLFRHYPLFRYGEYAVEYFVILSGVSYSLFSSTKPTTTFEYFKYLKRRLGSLFPAFFLVNVILYVSSFCFPSGAGRPFSFVEFLASTTGLSMYLGWKYISNVMWFMPFIIQVYFLLPLVDGWARRLNPVILMLVAFGVSCLSAQMVSFFVHDGLTTHLICKNWSPIFRLPEVCAGVIVGQSVLQCRSCWKAMLAVTMFGILSLASSQANSIGVMLNLYMPWGGFLVPVALFGVAALISPLLRSVNAGIIRLLALSSFFFYLFHAAPMFAIYNWFGGPVYIWASYFLACWCFAIGFTLVFSQFQKRVTGWRSGHKK